MRIVVATTALLLLGGSGLWAQDADIVARMRKAFDDCFWESAVAQIQASGSRDAGMVGEMAFQACLSEERAMRLVLATSTLSRTQIETAILTLKLGLKRSLQDVVKNPKKYVN